MDREFSQKDMIISQIKGEIANFFYEADKAVEGNKAAGVRSRKASSELEKLLKEWRKISVKN